jgi:hypothetical protein
MDGRGSGVKLFVALIAAAVMLALASGNRVSMEHRWKE